MADILQPAAHWPLASNGADLSGHGRDLTQVGTVAHGVTLGRLCAQGLGSTNYYTLASPSWLASKSAFTLVFEAYRATQATSAACAVAFGGAATVANAMYPNNSFINSGYRHFSNNVIAFAAADALPPAGQWNQIAFVVESAASAKIYRNNGTPIAYTGSSLATPESMTAIRLGNYYNGGPTQPFDGDVREVRVYLEAFTAADVDALYHYTGARRAAPGLRMGFGFGF